MPVPGSVIRMRGQTQLYDKALNPGSFSYRAYYDSIGVFLKFKAEHVEILSEGNPLIRGIYRFRSRLSEAIDAFADPWDTGLLKSMLVSDVSSMEDAEKDAFSFLGLLQMVSLSGLQLLFLGNLIFQGLRKKTGKKVVSFAAGLMVMLVFSLFTGFSASSLRALIIYVIRCGAVFLKRHFDLASGCALALILFMLETPSIVFYSGFQYMAGILFAMGVLSELVLRVLKIRGGGYRALFSALSVQTVMLPLRLYYSYMYSLLSPFLYALLLPMYGIVFLLGLTAAVLSLFSASIGAFLFGAEHYFVQLIRLLADTGSRLPFLTVVTGRPGTPGLLLYGFLLLLLTAVFRIILNRRKKIPEEKERTITPELYLKAASAFLLVLVFGLLILHAPGLPKDTAELIMLDCGQGDAFLFRTGTGTVILSDAGSTSDDSFYEDQLSKTLLYYGIRRIDHMIASHPDQDHISALEALLKDRRFETGHLIYSSILEQDPGYETLFAYAEKAGTARLAAEKGKILPIQDGNLTFLWPYPDGTQTGNEASLVYLLTFRDRRILFTGDISSEEEGKLQGLTDTDILKVPHHGSRYSSSDRFLSEITPEIALISAARYNSYGHPAGETLDRLTDAGAKIYVTRHDGAVILQLSPDGILAKRML